MWLTFGFVVRNAQELVLSEADSWRHKIRMELLRTKSDVLIVVEYVRLKEEEK